MIQSFKSASLSALETLKAGSILFILLLVFIDIMINAHHSEPVTDWFNPYVLEVENIDPSGTVHLKYGRYIKKEFLGEYHIKVYDDTSGFPVCIEDKTVEYKPLSARSFPEAHVTLNQFVGNSFCNSQLISKGKYTMSVSWTIHRYGYYPTAIVVIRDVNIEMP